MTVKWFDVTKTEPGTNRRVLFYSRRSNWIWAALWEDRIIGCFGSLPTHWAELPDPPPEYLQGAEYKTVAGYVARITHIQTVGGQKQLIGSVNTGGTYPVYMAWDAATGRALHAESFRSFDLTPLG